VLETMRACCLGRGAAVVQLREYTNQLRYSQGLGFRLARLLLWVLSIAVVVFAVDLIVLR